MLMHPHTNAHARRPWGRQLPPIDGLDMQFFQTVAGPGATAYPEEPDEHVPMVYYAEKLTGVSFEKTPGATTLNGTGTGEHDYIFQLCPTYLEPGTKCLCWREQGQWYSVDPVKGEKSINPDAGWIYVATRQLNGAIELWLIDLLGNIEWQISIPDLVFCWELSVAENREAWLWGQPSSGSTTGRWVRVSHEGTVLETGDVADAEPGFGVERDGAAYWVSRGPYDVGTASERCELDRYRVSDGALLSTASVELLSINRLTDPAAGGPLAATGDVTGDFAYWARAGGAASDVSDGFGVRTGPIVSAPGNVIALCEVSGSDVLKFEGGGLLWRVASGLSPGGPFGTALAMSGAGHVYMATRREIQGFNSANGVDFGNVVLPESGNHLIPDMHAGTDFLLVPIYNDVNQNDAKLYCLDLPGLTTRWTVALASDLGPNTQLGFVAAVPGV